MHSQIEQRPAAVEKEERRLLQKHITEITLKCYKCQFHVKNENKQLLQIFGNNNNSVTNRTKILYINVKADGYFSM